MEFNTNVALLNKLVLMKSLAFPQGHSILGSYMNTLTLLNWFSCGQANTYALFNVSNKPLYLNLGTIYTISLLNSLYICIHFGTHSRSGGLTWSERVATILQVADGLTLHKNLQIIFTNVQK